MKTRSLKLNKEINPEIKVGDKVRIVDGSGLTHIEGGHYIILKAYPELTGNNRKLEDIIGTVTAVNQEYIVESVCNTAYLQDIIVKIGEAEFRTCSKFVVEVIEPTYSVGQRFRYSDSFGNNDVFLLSHVTYNHVTLINLKSGNRYDEPIRVANAHKITEDEWTKITGIAGKFKLID